MYQALPSPSNGENRSWTKTNGWIHNPGSETLMHPVCPWAQPVNLTTPTFLLPVSLWKTSAITCGTAAIAAIRPRSCKPPSDLPSAKTASTGLKALTIRSSAPTLRGHGNRTLPLAIRSCAWPTAPCACGTLRAPNHLSYTSITPSAPRDGPLNGRREGGGPLVGPSGAGSGLAARLRRPHLPRMDGRKNR